MGGGVSDKTAMIHTRRALDALADWYEKPKKKPVNN
jgi:hypothetical protein